MIRRGTKTGGFTLIELLISISIIGILLALVIPNIDRSLSGNDLANDAEIFKSKVEETRLMASSTQQVDSGTSDADAYYGVYLPPDTTKRFYTIVRVTKSGAICPVAEVVSASNDTSLAQTCIVQRIALSRNVSFQAVSEQLILFRVPTQQTFRATKVSGSWTIGNPDFGAAPAPSPVLTYDTKRATLNIEAYTAKVTITYTNN